MLSDIFNIIGLIGVGLVLSAYFLLQFNKINAKGILFSLINLIGAVLILLSLLIHWNLASVVIEVFWIMISFYGLVRAVMRVY